MSDAEIINSLLAGMKMQRADADKKRLAEIKSQWDEFGEVRDKDLLLRIGFSSQEFFDSLMAQHPAKKLKDSVENVERAFDILSQSHSAFVDLAGKFHNSVVYNLVNSDSREAALNQATKEIYTYSCASYSLVQAYRHMISYKEEELKGKFDRLRGEIFGEKKIIKFFSNLRRSNNHIHVLAASPHYAIRMGETREVTSGISFDRKAILDSKDWSSESKALVKERENLEVIELMNEHFQLASNFKSVVLFRTGINSDKAYRDIKRILHARKVIGMRVSLGLILQAALKNKVNPYEYLHRWFTESELKNIYCFEDYTKEQLEYMISLRDPFGFCDGHTRRDLYKLFSIPLEHLPDQPAERPRFDI